MHPIEITSVDDPRIKVFAGLTEAQLRNSLHPEEGLFIAESPKVIRVALDSGLIPVALLCERRHIEGDAADIIARIPDIPIYTGSREVLAAITGYTLTRGVLCAMRRPELPSVEELCDKSGRVVVIDDVSDTTNIGSIFRSAAALGMDAVFMGPTACDPLNRRAVRVSMGSVFLIPWTRLDGGLDRLKACGFKTVAMALRHNSVDISDPLLKGEPKLAIVMGTEGEGLPIETIDSADYVVKIPMHHGVDSLNVAAASAIAFYALSLRQPST
ncbi:MAG: RNA methyltransferase [Muribaculaceae bacterium]|nr:RNA methyltransferase [Muribaculaceae bacterium]